MIVVLATAMQQGPAPWRMRRLREEFGMSPQTLERWRAWWRAAREHDVTAVGIRRRPHRRVRFGGCVCLTGTGIIA
jgi:hypothetical protein